MQILSDQETSLPESVICHLADTAGSLVISRMQTRTQCSTRLSPSRATARNSQYISAMSDSNPEQFRAPWLWSSRINSGFMNISANFVQQRLRRCRNSNFAVKNVVAIYIVAVHGFVPHSCRLAPRRRREPPQRKGLRDA